MIQEGDKIQFWLNNELTWGQVVHIGTLDGDTAYQVSLPKPSWARAVMSIIDPFVWVKPQDVLRHKENFVGRLLYTLMRKQS